jgi:hypothetical protein
LSGPHIIRQRAVGAAQDANVLVESRKDVSRTPSRIGIDGEAGGERQCSFFEPFDAQELVARRFFGRWWLTAQGPTSEVLRHGRKSAYAIAMAVAMAPPTEGTTLSFRRTARSCAMLRARHASQRASKSESGAIVTAEDPPLLTGSATVVSLGSMQPSEVCFGEG